MTVKMSTIILGNNDCVLEYMFKGMHKHDFSSQLYSQF